MEIKKILFIVILGIGLFSTDKLYSASTTDQKQVTASQSGSEFDILFDENGKEVPGDVVAPPMSDEPGGPPPEGFPAPGAGFGDHDGRGMRDGPRKGMDMDGFHQSGVERHRRMGTGGMRGPNRDMFWGRTDPEALLKFLKEYEPVLASKLDALQQKDPRAYRRKMGVIGRIYGPVMQQMERNPEIGKLSLQRIRLRLRTEQQLRDIQSNKGDKTQNKADLRESVAKMFDVILSQEELRYQWLSDRIQNKVDKDKQASQASDADSQGRGKDRPMRRHFLKRFEQHKEQIELWRKNRDQIIDQHVEEMISGTQPFPWGR